ncbi:Ger(x)C family spore germination protein [Agathobaculum sp.]|uniref:Ger(x)C family spore germination protein n=1 Tax=Agathobaculum sp. TaxID=2048138 RepID=UPI003FA495E7
MLVKLLLPVILLALYGCSREVSPVSALALDKTAGGYRLTAEIVRQDSLDEAASPAYLTVSGSDMPDLLQRLGNLLPGELYLSHAQVLLLDESAAEESILPLADYLCADNDVRLSLRVAVVRGSAAADLMRNDDEVYALSELLERAAREGTLPDMPLYRAAEVLHASGTAILPALHLDEFGQTAPDGTAVFANSQLSCFLDGSGIGGGAVGA